MKLLEKISCQLNSTDTFPSDPQKNRQPLGIGQRLGTPLLQFLARAIIFGQFANQPVHRQFL